MKNSSIVIGSSRQLTFLSVLRRKSADMTVLESDLLNNDTRKYRNRTQGAWPNLLEFSVIASSAATKQSSAAPQRWIASLRSQ
jgi:hypothetical protein